jgi:hypothetical protein
VAEKHLSTYTLTVTRESRVSFDRKTREAILPCFPAGTPAMNDERRFKCEPADSATVLEDGEWFATSAKFSAWTDNEGSLHSEDVIHLSVTNESAMDRMQEICLLEAVHEADIWDSPVPTGAAMEPAEVLAAIRKLLGLPVAATQQEINEQIRRLFPAYPSPEMASVEKEPEMEKAQAPPLTPLARARSLRNRSPASN